MVGSDCLLMAYAHVAHDCEFGNHVVIANSVNMARARRSIEDWVIVGGLTADPPVRPDRRARVRRRRDPGSPRTCRPYCRAAGNPPRLFGLNSVGLERRGFSEEVRKALKQTYRHVFMSGLNVSQGVDRAEEASDLIPEVRHFLNFIKSSKRGITVG